MRSALFSFVSVTKAIGDEGVVRLVGAEWPWPRPTASLTVSAASLMFSVTVMMCSEKKMGPDSK